MDIKAILAENGIQTRIVPCELNVSFSKLTSDNVEILKKEYIALPQNRYGSIMQWLNKNKAKKRTEETDELLLELLVELYQKVENIERILQNKAIKYVVLDSEVIADSIGHSVLCTSSAAFEANEKYYLRVFLPIFPQRHVGIFARAITSQIVAFEQIQQNDLEDFDSFVAQMERLMILDSKRVKE